MKPSLDSTLKWPPGNRTYPFVFYCCLNTYILQSSNITPVQNYFYKCGVILFHSFPQQHEFQTASSHGYMTGVPLR